MYFFEIFISYQWEGLVFIIGETVEDNNVTRFIVIGPDW